MEKKESTWSDKHSNYINYRKKRIGKIINCYEKILLHIPHSSTLFPEDTKYTFEDLDSEERLLIDYYTDELFIPEQEDKRISSVTFPYCRLYCDVERMINDPLESKGLGISFSRWMPSNYGHTYRSFSSLYSVFKLYLDYHTRVSEMILNSGANPLLIDCHSFSNRPNLLNKNVPTDIDICIGFNDDKTLPNPVAVGNIAQYFREKGYKVGINTPFSNSKTFNAPKDYHSVMIEVNKRLYMNEDTLEKTGGFDKLKKHIQELYKILLKM